MKLQKFFLFILALPLFVAGCNNDPDVTSAKLSLTLASDIMSFNADGGTGIITYSLTNAPKDAKVEATCDAYWISNIKVGTNIIFSVLPNEDMARSAEIVVSYKEESFTVTIDQESRQYVQDITFTSAARIPLVGQYPDNYFYILLSNDDNTADLMLMLIGKSTENVLSAGTYDDSNDTTFGAYNMFYTDDEEITFKSFINTIIVEGDINNYSIVAKFTDADKNQYRFRFNGLIEYMAESINHFTCEDVTMEAKAIDGIYYEQEFSNTFNYTIYLSDLGFADNGDLLANGTYFNIDLYGEEPVIDAEGYLIVPAGTYTINPNYEYVDWTISPDYSSYGIINEYGTGYYSFARFDTATVTITENSVHVEATIGSATYTATYNGAPKFYVGVEEPIEDRDIVAQALDGIYYGNEYQSTYNYFLMLSDLGFTPTGDAIPGAIYYTLDLFGLEPQIDAQGYVTIPAGTYTYDKMNTSAAWTVGKRYSSYCLINADGSDYEEYESFDDITVVVSENGINITAELNGGHHTLVYNGAPKFYAGMY